MTARVLLRNFSNRPQQLINEKCFYQFINFVGDFEEALAYYSRSISLVRTAASVNNRALTYLRLEKWKKAEQDCNEVLKLEKNNVKARLRRASALKELNRYEEAKKDLDFVLEVVSFTSMNLSCEA